MRSKQRATLRKSFCVAPNHPPPPPLPFPPLDKILLRLRNKTFLTEVCRNIQTSFAFKELEECSFWASRNGAVQMFFLTPKKNMFAGNC